MIYLVYCSLLYLLDVLKFFNFGNSLCNWFKLFYNNVTSTVVVNGWPTEFFHISRGVRQGDPLSPYLFTIGVEILGYLIRCNNSIRGIHIGHTEVKISQYADDTLFFLDGSDESLLFCTNILHFFGDFSGLKLNNSKSKLIWIGANHSSNEDLKSGENFIWDPGGSFDYLGITFSVNIPDIVTLNYNSVIDSIQRLIEVWSKRYLTVLGRVNPDSAMMRKLNSMLYNFIWKSSIDKVKRVQMIQTFEKGGVKMIDLDAHFSSLKVSWIKRLTNSCGQWVSICYSSLPHNCNTRSILDYDYNVYNNMLSESRNKFWVNVFCSWIDFKVNYLRNLYPSRDNIVTQSLWFNDDIVVDNDTLYYKSWDEKGVRFINDLLSSDGRFLSLDEFTIKYIINTNFLHFYSLIRAIKFKWGELFSNCVYPLDNPIQSPISAFLSSFSRGCKPFYKNFLSFYKFEFKPRNKWQDDLGDAFADLDWSFINKNPFICTNNVNLRWLQFRINNRIIGTNYFLFKINISNSNTCSFCKTEIETIKHLFYSCVIVQQFWNQLLSIKGQDLFLTLAIV